jgi:hypothetical protein
VRRRRAAPPPYPPPPRVCRRMQVECGACRAQRLLATDCC